MCAQRADGAAAGTENAGAPVPTPESFTTFRPSARSRVIVVEDAGATEAFKPRAERVADMLARGLTALTGKPTAREAWLSLVSTQDVVGVRVYSVPGPDAGTRPAVAAAIVRGLLDAGVPATQIVIWDKSERDLRDGGFMALARELGVRVAGSAEAGYDAEHFYEQPLIGTLVWGDLEFGQSGEGVGRRSFVSKLLTRELTRIINVPPLQNHRLAGVAGNLYGLAMASVDNTQRFEREAARLAQAVPEIYALPEVGDRVVLNIVDALLCQYEGGPRGLLHYSTVLNQLRLSRDPVALDVLSLRELERQRRAARAPFVKPNLELYRNAELLELGVSDPDRIDVETLP
ncbi:MAG: DUF362 domain-containing protein [Verrucomicrobiae bacterium]|nr:DUF362 domain-containing protein [Verrucomicrobiae bacterium]